jgi:pectate lyase
MMTTTSLMRHLAIGTAALVLAGGGAPAGAATGEPSYGRQVLGATNGWAAAGGGTTGGAAADAAHTYVVRTWDEFRAALGGTAARGDTTPRLVYVAGTLDANTRPGGDSIGCDDYADPEFSLDAYLETYDPRVWGRDAEPSGPLEDARVRSAANQTAQVRQFVGSNVTIAGLGRHARIVGANLVARDSRNVIVRNVRLSDAYDCFPQWDPTDGETGSWNSEYDNLWLYGSRNVWVDHVTFDDGEHPPAELETLLGAKFEVHDGLLDITNASDLVTVSYNRFGVHDKVMLIGSSDSRVTDRGLLRVTVHHNLFLDPGQRVPRVRFGDVHVYDNHYVYTGAFTGAGEPYAWGVGVESEIVAEQNVFTLARGQNPADLVRNWGGTAIQATGTLVGRGRAAPVPLDLVALHNAAHDPDLAPVVSWTPTLHDPIDPAIAVPAIVAAQAGAGRLR